MSPLPNRRPSFCGRIAGGGFRPGVSELLSISRCVRNFQEIFAEAAAESRFFANTSIASKGERRMSRVVPFRALRPGKAVVRQVAAPPYDVLSVAEAREQVRDTPLSFLHVEKSEIDLPD